MPDVLVAGVEDQVGRLADRAAPPLLQLAVEGRAARLTWALVTSRPQSSSVMAATLRVETPWTYISATASFNARSLRTPFSRAEG